MSNSQNTDLNMQFQLLPNYLWCSWGAFCHVMVGIIYVYPQTKPFEIPKMPGQSSRLFEVSQVNLSFPACILRHLSEKHLAEFHMVGALNKTHTHTRSLAPCLLLGFTEDTCNDKHLPSSRKRRTKTTNDQIITREQPKNN